MAKCKHKESCGYEVCLDDCCPEFEAAVETNADRIRSMSDEELAAFLLNFFVENMDINSIPHEEITAADEVELLRQLQQPTEGEKDGRAVLHGLPGQG